MNDFVAYPSRWKTALLAVASFGFVLIGLAMVGAFGQMPGSERDDPLYLTIVGWSGVLLFGLFGSVWVARLFGNTEHLRIGPKGVRYPEWCDQTIPWVEIDDVRPFSARGNMFLILHLRDRGRFPGRFPASLFAGLNRMITRGDVSISLTGTNRSFDEALSAVEHFRSLSVLAGADKA
ncbi:STM3941 family protein [Aureimonas jatrophae]|uniref:PH domain-containing protein n=1 Tax=Aureimonas jatrophae TaxID=1166073 RepID=A0A1H0MZ10_9HYPH|nr:STM3941 family protein [Aureimonas jatrophae]MBB3952959.1 hypothetical protein [Aureimonas jatrophae]SDO85622.1 hypothetical protein SAMN05192530_11617 [Aureimonas jatrophae]